jgi:FeS assembly SUF system regulator
LVAKQFSGGSRAQASAAPIAILGPGFRRGTTRSTLDPARVQDHMAIRIESIRIENGSQMRLSSFADYAVVMMAAAAGHPLATKLSATMLSAETGVPLPTAQKLMGKLAGAGLFSSTRGAAGGFELARAAAEISLADIVEAVEGPIALTTCVDDLRHDCALEQACRVKPHWGVVNDAVRGAFAGVSLASLSNPLPVRAELVEAMPFPFKGKGNPSTSSGRTELTQESIA